MTATIEIGDIQATISGGTWKSSDPVLTDFLNSVPLPLGILWGAVPDVDLFIAQAVADKLGGKVIGFEAREEVPGTEY